MEGPEVVWIENILSEEYEKFLKTAKYGIPLMIFIIVFGFFMLYTPTVDGRALGLGLATIGAVIAIFARHGAESSLSTKIGVSKEGLFFVKRNGKEGFVPWWKVYRIRVMDSRDTKDYILFYAKSANSFIEWLDKYFIDQPELALGFEAAQAVIRAYDEYKERAWR